MHDKFNRNDEPETTSLAIFTFWSTVGHTCQCKSKKTKEKVLKKNNQTMSFRVRKFRISDVNSPSCRVYTFRQKGAQHAARLDQSEGDKKTSVPSFLNSCARIFEPTFIQTGEQFSRRLVESSKSACDVARGCTINIAIGTLSRSWFQFAPKHSPFFSRTATRTDNLRLHWSQKNRSKNKQFCLAVDTLLFAGLLSKNIKRQTNHRDQLTTGKIFN